MLRDDPRPRRRRQGAEKPLDSAWSRARSNDSFGREGPTAAPSCATDSTGSTLSVDASHRTPCWFASRGPTRWTERCFRNARTDPRSTAAGAERRPFDRYGRNICHESGNRLARLFQRLVPDHRLRKTVDRPNPGPDCRRVLSVVGDPERGHAGHRGPETVAGDVQRLEGSNGSLRRLFGPAQRTQDRLAVEGILQTCCDVEP